MYNKSVYGIIESHQQAEKIVTSLKDSDFPNDRISVLFPDKSNTRDFAHEKNTKAPEGAVTGGITGGIFGGALGWIAGIGALAIPGFGPFIAAGPLAAAIGGVAIGTTIGGIAGGLIGMGLPEIEAKRFEGKVKDGNILISVHAKNDEELNRAKKILESHKATDICTASMEKSSKFDEKKSDKRAETKVARENEYPERNHPAHSNQSTVAPTENRHAKTAGLPVGAARK